MRTIKFRAWDGNSMIYEGWNGDFFATKEIIFRYDRVQQFTNLLDKNGKEIYEGDVLKARYGPNYNLNTYEIKWYEGGASFVCYRKHENPNVSFVQLPLQPSNSMEDLEIIGNIYDNPELLTPARMRDK